MRILLIIHSFFEVLSWGFEVFGFGGFFLFFFFFGFCWGGGGGGLGFLFLWVKASEGKTTPHIFN
jgi:hypothetical protein